MAESGYGLAGLGMGKVKSFNQYRLTPGFGGSAMCHMKQLNAALHAADAASRKRLHVLKDVSFLSWSSHIF
ncbi:TPA: hypothetical protein ACQY9B_004353 [Escherichia coli]|uniref:hypothetical protein n=1 Tax=Escherichia coli TaxID=562 RepID=UPI00287C384A|nr:hypothetical protein [Escherichia coli]